MTARALMVWGCTSDAGKSFLATALCRWYADRGLRVAPFKAQNMSNNARVVDDGEIGCAQWFQAMAARRTPEVRHNPVLLKPESDTRSQVVVMGQVDWELTCMDWRSRSVLLWDRARVALRELLEENDLVVMEGAGSPSEINLSSCDFVNLHSVREADARCIMVSDIDRGGAFAHLFGTWSLLPDDLKGRVDGFVLNKFRGNPGLLAPGPELLRERTGVPLLGTLPRIAHQLPDEDAVALEQFATALRGEVRHRVGIVAWPRISNFDEFRRLAAWPGVEVRLVRQPSHCLDLDLLVLPGSKNVPSDLQWLRERGLDREIERFAHGGGPVLGICGGFQALGGRILDPVGAEGDGVGLGLLDVRTVHGPAKRTGCVRSRAPQMDGFWRNLSGMEVSGYQIRTGTCEGSDPLSREGLFRSNGGVLGTYVHGMLELPQVLAALFGKADDPGDPLEGTFRELGRMVDEHLDARMLETIAAGGEAKRPTRRPARLAVLTGGVRAGKSSAAQELALSWGGGDVTVVATAQGLDEEMRERIRVHRLERPSSWETIEEPLDVPGAIRRAAGSVVLLDCLNLWITNLLLSPQPVDFRQSLEGFLDSWRGSGKDVVVVTNEVGWGIVPDNALSREFRDQLGWANQKLVASSTEAWLHVAGARIPLKVRQ